MVMSARPDAPDVPVEPSPAAPATPTAASDGDRPLISARGLTKRFGGYVAVDGVDFDVQRGEVFGFLGPNGAGKTTTMRMIACVSPVTGGDLSVLGSDPRHDGTAIRARLGVVPQEDNLDTELTVWDNLLIYGRYFGLPVPVIRERAAELLRFARLDDRRDSRVDPLSGGMKRRLIIARALINRPDLLLLDEPTTGLDPQSRRQLWDVIARFRAGGGTVLLTTHYMEEAERLCDRVAIVDHGRVIALGQPRELVASLGAAHVVEVATADAAALDPLEGALAALPGVRGVRLGAGRASLTVSEVHRAVPALLALLAERGAELSDLATHHATLEDVFVSLTGRHLRDA